MGVWGAHLTNAKNLSILSSLALRSVVIYCHSFTAPLIYSTCLVHDCHSVGRFVPDVRSGRHKMASSVYKCTLTLTYLVYARRSIV